MSCSCNSIFLLFSILAINALEYAEGTLLNSSWLRSKTSLQNSKPVFVKYGEERFLLLCPISTSPPSTESTLILWLIPNRHVVVTEDVVDVENGKYRLVDSTGELEIINVSDQDGGIYRCVMRERKNQTCVYRTSGVNLIIEKVPHKLVRIEKKKEYSNSGSATRAMAAVGGAIFIFTILFSVHHFRWRKHSKHTFIHITPNPEEDVNNLETGDRTEALVNVAQPKISDSSNYAYVNKGFSITPSDTIYVIPESTSQLSSTDQNKTDLTLQNEPEIGARTMLTVPSGSRNLKDEDIDGLSSCYPLHNPPFRLSSLQQSRREKKSQLRIKSWWLNPLPTGEAPDSTNTDGS